MKSVLITGASGGIGSAAARLFAERGYGVAACRCGSPPGEEGYLWIKADATSESEALEAVQKTEAAFGKVDALVYAAGAASSKLFTDISAAEWREMLAVHLDGAFNFCKHF